MTEDPRPPIVVEDVVKDFGSRRALSRVSLSVETGEVFGLAGPNGSGKTTLIHLLLGLGRPGEGTIRVLGHLMPSRAAAGRIGYMTQATALYGELSIRENLTFFARLYGLDRSTCRARVGEVLDLVDLEDRIDSPVVSLSGGMRQRVSLAIALLHQPRLLILDEPTVGIDPELRLVFWDHFGRLAASGVTILLSTHHLDEARKCHRIALLRAGSLLALDTPEAMLRESGEEDFDKAFLYFASLDGRR
jgi:ABC-2 type transport system ATP-binding protein